MRLVFGSLGKILKLCSTLTSKEMVGVLAQVIDPLSRYVENDPAIHRLLNCDIDFVSGTDNTLQKADIIQKLEEQVIPHLRPDKRETIILALCDVIHKDESMDSDYRIAFRQIFGVDRKEVLVQCVYFLSDFLASTLLFTIFESKNRNGKPYIKKITEDYLTEVSKCYADEIAENSSSKIIVFPIEQIYSILEQALQECHIQKFIETDPTGSVKEYLIEDAGRFVTIMTTALFRLNKGDAIHRKVIEFTQVLNEYHDYLGRNMRPLLALNNPSASVYSYHVNSALPVSTMVEEIQKTEYRATDTLVPLYGNENARWEMEFEKVTRDYREKTISIYHEIAKLQGETQRG